MAHNFPRHVGDGAGAFLLRLATALADRGVPVHAVAPAAPGLAPSETLSGVPVTRFRYAPRRWETLAYGGTMIAEARRTGGVTLLAFLAAARRATRNASRAHRATIVHAHWWFPGGLAAASVTPLPLVTTMHGTDVRIARSSGPARRAMRWVLKRSAACTTVSEWLAARVREMAPAATPIVAPMPAAVELFTPGTRPADGPILFVGRFNRQKGVRHLLDAVARMRSRVRVRLIGAGPDGDRLRRQAAELGIADRLEWLPPQPQQALAEHYRQAAVVVVPSIEEGLGLVAVEAQLCGAPVIAAASGGLPDVVDDGRTGVLVPAAAPEPLARAMDALLADREHAAVLGRNGRAAALAKFAPEAVAARYEDIYRQACDAS